MSVLWPASQRPMYIKTVWVGGFRHAILSKDDPYYNINKRKRRPHSSTTCSTVVTKKYPDQEFDQQSKFNFIVTSDKTQTKKEDYDIEKLDLSDVEDSEDDFVLKANQQPLCEADTNRNKFNNLGINMRTLKSNRTARTEEKENTDLSDRVLQWLDLAGKVDLLAAANPERMTQPRHSWPEIQRRNQNITKSKTAVDFRTKDSKPSPKPVDSAREQHNNCIDRHEYYTPNSSANAIENYARRSRNAKNTPPPAIQTKREHKDDKPKTKQPNIAETRQKVAAERNAVEKQYNDMITKKLIPDVKTKKQVHIFMPEAISKKIYSNATSRTESLLSHKI